MSNPTLLELDFHKEMLTIYRRAKEGAIIMPRGFFKWWQMMEVSKQQRSFWQQMNPQMGLQNCGKSIVST